MTPPKLSAQGDALGAVFAHEAGQGVNGRQALIAGDDRTVTRRF